MNKPLLIKLANRIKELRKQQKITQDELAYRAKHWAILKQLKMM